MAKNRSDDRKVVHLFSAVKEKGSRSRRSGKPRKNGAIESGRPGSGLKLEGVTIFGAVVLCDYEQALFHMLGQIVEMQNAAFDEVVRRLLGHLAEDDNVRDVLKTWEMYREEIEDQLDAYFEMLKSRSES